jgi:hypothetical protein
MLTETYAGHQLEDGVLCLFEERGDFHKTLHHGSIITNSPSHAGSQLSTQGMVNVEFVRGSRCEECIVQSYKH